MVEKRGSKVERLAGIVGLTIGLAVVMLAVSGWRIPGGDGHLGADIFFSSGPTGELEVSPSGPFLRATSMRPGGEAHGSLMLRNQTGARLAIRVRGLPDRPDLDGLLQVEVRSGKVRLFSGTLGRLLRWSHGALVLRSGERGQLDFRAWLPADLKVGYQGRIASVPFELKATRTR